MRGRVRRPSRPSEPKDKQISTDPKGPKHNHRARLSHPGLRSALPPSEPPNAGATDISAEGTRPNSSLRTERAPTRGSYRTRGPILDAVRAELPNWAPSADELARMGKCPRREHFLPIAQSEYFAEPFAEPFKGPVQGARGTLGQTLGRCFSQAHHNVVILSPNEAVSAPRLRQAQTPVKSLESNTQRQRQPTPTVPVGDTGVRVRVNNHRIEVRQVVPSVTGGGRRPGNPGEWSSMPLAGDTHPSSDAPLGREW